MTVTGGEPPSFPSVGGPSSDASHSASSSSPLFTPADQPVSPPPVGGASSPPATQPQRGSRVRWLVAGIATLVVLAIVVGVVIVAVPRSSAAASALAHYAPADTAMYAELRLDLPGDQEQNLAAFMSHFPGFADQSSFQQKLNDTLDTILKDKSNGAIDWNNDVKPWFGGQLALFGNAPQASAASGQSAPPDEKSAAPVAYVLSVSDRTLLEAGLTAKLGSTQPTTTTYQGTQIITVAPASLSGEQISYAVTDDALIASPDMDLVKEALDVHAGAGAALADDPFYTQQLAQLDADRLATFYFDASKAATPMAVLPDASGAAECMQSLESATKVKGVGELRAESDHLALTVRTQQPTGSSLPAAPSNSQTNLAQTMPSDTVAYIETHGLGANIDWLIQQELSCMSSAGGSDNPLASGLGILNGSNSNQLFQQLLGTSLDQYFDFVQDAAAGITYRNAQPDGGIVATVDDQAVATARVDKLTSLLGLAGSFGGSGNGSASSGITTQQVDHNGTTITVIHYMPQTSDGGSPIDLAVATTNGKLYLGTQTFVTAALDQDASNSLATNATYQQAVSAAPQSNLAIAYVDLGAVRTALQPQLSQDQQQYLAPLTSAALVSHLDGDMVVTNGFLYVK